MIAVRFLDGSQGYLRPEEFIRLRAPFLPSEIDSGAQSIVDAPGRRLLSTPLAEVLSAVRALTPTPEFTAPNGQPVYVVAAKIRDILPSVHRHPSARAVLDLSIHEQQVRQTPEEARRLMSDARLTALSASDRASAIELGEFQPDPTELSHSGTSMGQTDTAQ